jgi:Xaa-Pro aminopeptidase
MAAEAGGLSWDLGTRLEKTLAPRKIVPGDQALARARAVKTSWELAKMRLCGARHHAALHDLVPREIAAGMSEREIAHAIWRAFFSLGHTGQIRMGNFGEEIFLGHVAAGDSGNYPSVFNGPLGLRGEHPAVPFGGYAGKVWRMGEPLTCDVGFGLEGYNTDKTQVYWPGRLEELPGPAADGHAFCVETQAQIAEMLVPGALPQDIYAKAVGLAQKAGLEDGFMALGANKVPFVGHGIGLVIDEWPPLAKGVAEPLQAGMVLAVEPKLGIAGFGMVGVENTFEVTDTGGACLTGDSFAIVCLGDL